MSETVLGNALAFARRGYPVLPLYWPIAENGRLICACRRKRDECTSPAKHPLTPAAPRGLFSATTDTGVVKHWFGYRFPDANYGVRTDGALFALDIDPRHGGDQTLAALEREHGELPHTWRAITGSGGEHILFNAENLALKRGRAPDVGLGDGIDAPFYIVGAGSRHICGRPYAWNVDHYPSETELERPPQWLIERLSTSTVARSRPPEDWAREHAGRVTAYRDLAIAQVAGKLLRAVSLDPAFVATLVHDWNACHCDPPLPEREVAAIIARLTAREIARLEGNHARG